ncbi:lytic transglycosylase domain-containing protein [Desulfovibrio sp. SGI.169]|uniref:lytic transglycosylase domain-containing protein n=1 Tax=Desulfovibrio sp. SGI.169 TaxID=3420561 RepID=UPI003CFE5FEC
MRTAFFLLVALWLLPDAVFAAERAKVAFPPLRPLTADCVLDAAHSSGMPAAALFAILATEGGKTGEALSNKNGTWDMGPFQVNTVHLNELAAMGISPDAVLRDGRVNAYAAAWLLRKEYRRTGNLWRAIGAYHSRTPHRRDAYIRRVKSNLERLRREGVFTLSVLEEGRR